MQNYHMTPDEFRQRGRQLIDWIADYMENVEKYPVLSQVGPGDVRAALPRHPPEHGEDWDHILTDVDEVILPGVTHWQSPNFFAYFNGNSSGPSVLGELLAAGLGTQGMLWATSPAATELETHVLDWLAEMLDLPEPFHSTATGGGVIQDTASTAVLCAVLAARERATGSAANETGVPAGLRAYASREAHSSVEKAVRIAGIGSANLRAVPVDADFAIRPDELDALLTADRDAGLTPAFVNATVGTTSSTAIDPVRAIGEVCRRHGVWLHVDAAFFGTAAICPEFRHIQDGVELADSYNFNPHKWMFTNLDCSALYVADRRPLVAALSILPEYLRNQASEADGVIDYRNWQVALGRRFRALKLWFVIRHYGVEGLRHHIREHVRIAQQLAAQIAEHPDFDLAAPAHLNLVCFRHRGGDAANEAILGRLNASGALHLTHTKLGGAYTLRMSIGQTYTEERHVQRAWELIRRTATAVMAGESP